MSGSGTVLQKTPHLSASRQHFQRRPLASHQRVFCSAAQHHHQRSHRRTQRCQAEERSRDSTKTQETEKLIVPDTPPAKESRESADSASSSQTAEVSEELKLLQQRRRDSQAAAPSNYVQAVLQEVRLIEWPKPKSAVLNTVLVIGIVGAATVFLLALNSLLAETSKLAYR